MNESMGKNSPKLEDKFKLIASGILRQNRCLHSRWKLAAGSPERRGWTAEEGKAHRRCDGRRWPTRRRKGDDEGGGRSDFWRVREEEGRLLKEK